MSNGRGSLSFVKALAALVALCVLFVANAAWAACTEGTSRPCTLSGCSGRTYCEDGSYSECVVPSSCSGTNVPLSVKLRSEGIAGGRFDVTDTSFPIGREKQVFFMKDTSFTIRADASASVGVKEVKLLGTVSTKCEEASMSSIDRTGVTIVDAGSSESNLYAANIPVYTSSSLATSIAMNLATQTCGSSELDRIVVKVWAEAKDNYGTTARSHTVEFIYVETPRFITLNIHEGRQDDDIGGKYDLDGTVAHIVRSRPDVVVLQDVRRYFDSKTNFDDQVPLLQQKLKMPYVYFRIGQENSQPIWCYTVNPFDPICQYDKRQSGQLLLSRFPITSTYNHFFYNREFHDIQNGWQQPGALEATLDTGGPMLLVGAIHYPIYCATDDVPSPVCQYDASVKIRDAFSNRGMPTIIGGDFNAYRDQWQMSPIENSFLDEVSDFVSDPQYSIDNIFVWNAGTAPRFEVVSAYFTDLPPGVVNPTDEHGLKVARVRVINYP